jgi:hypothetical protein
MNRRDFLKAGAVASVVGALPVVADAQDAAPVFRYKEYRNRMERYQEYRTIMNDNFELNDKIQKIAGEAANRVSNFPHAQTLGYFAHLYQRYLYRAYNLAIYGDGFYELVYAADYPSDTLIRRPILAQELLADTVYRIETIKGKVIEYQQSKTGPDYAALSQPLEGTDPRLMLINNSTAIRWRPDQIYHLRIGGPVFYPYGVSLLEPIRKNPAASIGEGAIENFMTMFSMGMQDLKDLCK